MMRALVDLRDEQVSILDAMAREGGTSRAALVREAIDEWLNARRKERLMAQFGGWADAGRPYEDGLAYQMAMRAEWDHRP
ncbi:ribbon-helix-helix domain-containing protein [Sandaracinobacteroides saxicola]|nr:CopG family transcriptional regulator [Sandaracinobacteroides saxicola]